MSAVILLKHPVIGELYTRPRLLRHAVLCLAVVKLVQEVSLLKLMIKDWYLSHSLYLYRLSRARCRVAIDLARGRRCCTGALMVYCSRTARTRCVCV